VPVASLAALETTTTQMPTRRMETKRVVATAVAAEEWMV